MGTTDDGEGDWSGRDDFVAEVNAMLVGSFNEAGIARWWVRPRRRLGGQTPAEAISGEFDLTSRLVEEVRRMAEELVGAGGLT